ncbi:MAG: hypothetical protein JOZ52_14935, partial [Acidobacteria bacterium]|nr:hypothetical protein [Acidobacteriota bacterium]
MKHQSSAGHTRYPKLFIFALIGLLIASSLLIWPRAERVRAQAQNDAPSPEQVVYSESFDTVTAPSLPAGWTTSTAGLSPFTTTTTSPDSSPNAAFVPDPEIEGSSELVSPPIALTNLPHKLIFRHFYQTDFLFDGGVLEIKIGGGSFVDILQAGGQFVTGGYDATIGSTTLGGNRQAWTGQLVGYITTEINLPASSNGQTVQFRWRIGTDNMEGGTGWYIDNVQISNAISGTNFGAITIPSVGSASPYPSQITVSQGGLVTGVQVSLTNFSHNSPDDVDLMLIAPNGGKVVLMSDVGGSTPVTNLSLFFSDAASTSLPDNTSLFSGTFKPTDVNDGADSFPSPGGAPTGSRLSALNGSPADGAWQLCLVDDTGNNAGSVNGGWTLFVQSSPDVIAIPDSGTAQPYAAQKLITGLSGT